MRKRDSIGQERINGNSEHGGRGRGRAVSVMVTHCEEEGQYGANHQHGQLRFGKTGGVILPQAGNLHNKYLLCINGC